MNLSTKDSKTQEEIAGVFGLDRSRVSQIIGNVKINDTKSEKRRVLSPKEAQTVKLLAVRGESLEVIASQFGISKSR